MSKQAKFRCCWLGKAISHACESGLSVTRFFCPPLILRYVAAGCAGSGL
jgi:hypothetical protein